MSEIGERLKTARESAGISQLELAETLGYSQRLVSSWENGIRTPSLLQAIAVAKALHCSICWLAGDPCRAHK